VACSKPKPPTPLVSVTVTPVLQQNVVATKEWVGLLDGYQNANIQAQVSGYLLSQAYKEGSSVTKGTLLFTIDSRPFQAALAQAQANYAKAVAQAQLSQITLERQVQLFKTKVTSQQEYDTAYQDTQAAIATAAGMQAAMQAAQVNLDYCTVTAPFDGVVGTATAQIGDLVGPGGSTSVLTQISQINPMKLNFAITEAEYLGAADVLAELQAGSVAERAGQLSLTLADGSVYPEKGKFDFVNREINTSTGTISVTALFPNEKSVLRPGLFARVTAPVEHIENALLIPQAATVEVQGNYFASRLGPNNVVQPVPIKLGPTQGELVVVRGALKAGDKVIVEGIEKARAGTTVQPSAYVPASPAMESASAGHE